MCDSEWSDWRRNQIGNGYLRLCTPAICTPTKYGDIGKGDFAILPQGTSRSHSTCSAENVIRISGPHWKVTQSHTKVALGSPNSSKMSATDYRQPSHLNEFRVHRDEETHIIPPGASAERPVRININSYLRKIWRFSTYTIVAQDSWGNPTIATHSTTIHQRKSNSLELV